MSFDDQSGYSATPQKQGSGLKIVLIVLAVLAILVVLCCGSFGLFAYLAAKDAMSTDPVVIETARAEMLDIDVPEALSPQMKMSMLGMMTIVVYSDSAGDSFLNLGRYGKQMTANQSRQQIEQTFGQQASQTSGARSGESADWPSESEVKEVDINGEPVSFRITRLNDPDSERGRIQVTGSFNDANGDLILVELDADTEVVSEEEVIEMIESIQ